GVKIRIETQNKPRKLFQKEPVSTLRLDGKGVLRDLVGKYFSAHGVAHAALARRQSQSVVSAFHAVQRHEIGVHVDRLSRRATNISARLARDVVHQIAAETVGRGDVNRSP